MKVQDQQGRVEKVPIVLVFLATATVSSFLSGVASIFGLFAVSASFLALLQMLFLVPFIALMASPICGVVTLIAGVTVLFFPVHPKTAMTIGGMIGGLLGVALAHIFYQAPKPLDPHMGLIEITSFIAFAINGALSAWVFMRLGEIKADAKS